MATIPDISVDREILQFQLDFILPMETDAFEFSQMLYGLLQSTGLTVRITRIINTDNILSDEDKRSMN